MTVSQSPSIEGTYKLTHRELPDGKVQRPPDVMGMMTYTNEYRNFSVVWRDEAGKYYSECYVARYWLADSEYSETSQYLIIDDQIGGKGISYDLSERTARSAVSQEGGRIKFELPQPFERALSIVVEFEGGGLKATGKGTFIDHWEKVP